MATAAEMQAKITKFETNLARLNGIVNGPASGTDSLVTVDSGNTKTVSRVIQEILNSGVPIYKTRDIAIGLTIPTVFETIFVSGRSIAGTGGLYYRRAPGSTHPFRFTDAGGAVWEPTIDQGPLDALGASSTGIVVGIGTTGDYADVTTAWEKMRRFTQSGKQSIEFRFVSPITRGHFFERCDASLVRFTNGTGFGSVAVASGWQGVSDVGYQANERTRNLFAGYYATMPTLECIIDMQNTGDSGYYPVWGCQGLIAYGAGIINAGYNGLEVRGSYVVAYNTVWNGATGTGIRAAQAGIVSAQQATADNCCKNPPEGPTVGAVEASRQSSLYMRGSSIQNSGAAAANIRRNSLFNFEESNLSGAANYGLILQDASAASGWGAIIDNTRKVAEGGYGVWIRCGKLGMKGAFVRNSAATDAADIRIGDSSPATSGADIDATNVTTTAGINKIENILGADRFNVPTKYGIVWNAAVPAPLDIGNFSSTGASRGQDWDPEFHFLRSSSNSTNTSTHIQIFNPNGEVGRLTSSANAVTLTSTSDSRQKINQVKSEFDAISWLDTIQVDEYDMLDFRGNLLPDSHTRGFVAQKLFETAPWAVAEGGGTMGQEDYHPWGVAESKLIPEMMLAMQQMLAMIRELQS